MHGDVRSTRRPIARTPHSGIGRTGTNQLHKCWSNRNVAMGYRSQRARVIALAILLATVMLPLSPPVHATEIYKCKQADGSLASTNRPCEPASEELERRSYEEPAPATGPTWSSQTAPPAQQGRPRPASTDAAPPSTHRNTANAPAKPKGRSLAEHHSRLRGTMTPEQRRRLLREQARQRD